MDHFKILAAILSNRAVDVDCMMKLKERLLKALDEIETSHPDAKELRDALQSASTLFQGACNRVTDEIETVKMIIEAVTIVNDACTKFHIKPSNNYERLLEEIAIWLGYLKYKQLPAGEQYNPQSFVDHHGNVIDLKKISHEDLTSAVQLIKNNDEINTGMRSKSFKGKYFDAIVDSINDARKLLNLAPMDESLEEGYLRAFVHLIQKECTDDDFHSYCSPLNTADFLRSKSKTIPKFPYLQAKVPVLPPEEKHITISDSKPVPTQKIDDSKPSREMLNQAISDYVDSAHAERFNALVQAHLDRRKKEGKPLRILLYTWNHPSGIGDFVHNRDLLLYFEKLAGEDKRFQIQSLCILPPEKMKMVKAMLGDHVPAGQTTDVDYLFNDSESNFDIVKADSSRFIIWTGDWSAQRLCPPHSTTSRDLAAMERGTLEERNKTHLDAFLRKSDIAIMVSRPVGGLLPSNSGFIEEDTRQVLQSLSHAFRQAILELGVASYQCYSSAHFIHIAKSWGVNTTLRIPEVGVKVSTNIKKYKSLATTLGKAQFLNSYNPELLMILVGNHANQADIQAYFTAHHIGFGYLQEDDKFCSFLMANVVQASPRKNIDIFSNFSTEKFNTFFEYLEKHPKVIKFLQAENIGVIEGPDNRQIILLPEGKGRTISLRNFSGMSDYNKDCMIAIANLNAGSGDTSYSEEMDAASMGIPDLPDSLSLYFQQPRDWKGGYFKGLLTDMSMGKELPDLSILQGLIKRQLGLVPEDELSSTQRQLYKKDLFKRYQIYDNRGPNLTEDDIVVTTDVEFAEFIKKNRKELMEQWQIYCEHVYKNRNATTEQNHFFIRNIVSSILSQGTHEEVAELLRVFPSWEHDGINFVLHAADLNNVNLLNQLFKENKEQFIQLISREIVLTTGPAYSRLWSGIISLIKNDNLDMLKEIIPFIPLEKLQDIFLEAIKMDKKEIVNYFLENIKIDINRIKDNQTPLQIASELGLKNIVPLLLKHGANRTLLKEFKKDPARRAEYLQHYDIVRLINEPLDKAIESGDILSFEKMLHGGMYLDQHIILKIIERGNIIMFDLLLNNYAEEFGTYRLTSKFEEHRYGNIFHVLAFHGRHEMINHLADFYKKRNSYKSKLIITPSENAGLQEGLSATAAYLVVQNNTPETAEKNVKVIEALHKWGDNFDCHMPFPPMRLAIEKEDILMIKALRHCGADYDRAWIAPSKNQSKILAALEDRDNTVKRSVHFFKSETKAQETANVTTPSLKGTN